MVNTFKMLIIALLVGGFVFARNVKNNPSLEKNKVKGEHYWVKDHSKDDDDPLKRKRTHKRRRKIRKPVKGLR